MASQVTMPMVTTGYEGPSLHFALSVAEILVKLFISELLYQSKCPIQGSL